MSLTAKAYVSKLISTLQSTATARPAPALADEANDGEGVRVDKPPTPLAIASSIFSKPVRLALLPLSYAVQPVTILANPVSEAVSTFLWDPLTKVSAQAYGLAVPVTEFIKDPVSKLKFASAASGPPLIITFTVSELLCIFNEIDHWDKTHQLIDKVGNPTLPPAALDESIQEGLPIVTSALQDCKQILIKANDNNEVGIQEYNAVSGQLGHDVKMNLGIFKSLLDLQLNGVHPSGFSAWSNLSSQLLSLSAHNQSLSSVNDILQSSTLSWPALTILNLSNCSFASTDMESLSQLDHLEILNLSHCQLSFIPPSLGALPRLHSLDISHNSIANITKEGIMLGNIQRVVLANNQLESPRGLENLKGLTMIDLRNNNIHFTSSLQLLQGIPDLQELWIAGNPLTEQDPQYRLTILNIFARANHSIAIDGKLPSSAEQAKITVLPKAEYRGHHTSTSSGRHSSPKPRTAKRKQKRVIDFQEGSNIRESNPSSDSEFVANPHPTASLTDQGHPSLRHDLESMRTEGGKNWLSVLGDSKHVKD
ncbi:hypothetical protein BZG36_03227 [Bifiguratus adelaidae]|uniref:Disease resistance R13L4/SHOC-2-like LRR domain-containing protein n=1 Tax=Bifiguratus adelaidae TaxID=1938954 RepID=A0A261XX70_9FUNG|nr:hypothetical protein BZG36_03227 [Bifiguratus adelaidae]